MTAFPSKNARIVHTSLWQLRCRILQPPHPEHGLSLILSQRCSEHFSRHRDAREIVPLKGSFITECRRGSPGHLLSSVIIFALFFCVS
jgi:hypothetical protein